MSGRYHEGGMPDDPWNEIVTGVWVGGSERGYPGGSFDLVVSVYDWHKDRKRWLPQEGTPHIVMPMLDAPVVDEHKVMFLADAIEQFREEGRYRKILVRCQAGLNRSSLIVAAWMVAHQGYSAEAARQLLRDKRSRFALFNDHFYEWLEDLEARP